MKIKLITAFLALAISSFGQIITTVKPLDSFAASIRSDTSFFDLINGAPANFIWSGNFFQSTTVAPQAFFVGSNSQGAYKLKVSYIAERSDGENLISIGNIATNTVYTTLYSSYNANNFTYEVSSNSFIDVDFNNEIVVPNVSSWQNESDHFLWYVNFGPTGARFFGFIDDIGANRHDGDYNDVLIMVQPFTEQFQDLPPDIVPVPEPSTYTLIGSFMLLVAVMYKRLRK